MTSLRVHASSRGLDVRGLQPGRDVVLEVEQEHGLDLPEGVAAQDHLTPAAREDVDRAALEALARWRAAADARLEFDGVGLAWAWELELLGAVFIPSVRDAAAMAAAARALGADALELHGGGAALGALGAAAATHAGVEFRHVGAAAPVERYRPIAGSRWRQAAGRALRAVGVPSLLRGRSVLVLSYGPTALLLDRLLADASGPVAAASLAFPPATPAALAKAGRRGGWTGLPGVCARKAAERRLRPIFDSWSPVELDVLGMSLGEALDTQALEYGRPRAAADVAMLALLERAFDSGKVAAVVVPFDVVPEARLVVGTARRHGIPTLFLQHGIPGSLRITDGREASHRALWAEPYRDVIGGDAPVHVVGRPRMAAVTPPQARPLPAAPRAVVLAQAQERATAVMDARTMMRHFSAALEGLFEACPDARAVLRPHPAHDPAPAHLVTSAFAPRPVAVDTRSDVGSLFAEADLCIGALSTASAEAALAGIPVIALNITGVAWPWPFSPESDVVVVRDSTELARAIAELAAGRPARGHDELLRALGADRSDALGSIVRIVEELGAG